MKKSFPAILAFAGLIAAAIVAPDGADRATAAELRLRTQCNPVGPIVTLGDVAEIQSADSRQTAALAAIELFPAPSASEQRLIQVREIQDLLLLRGVNLTEQRFSGASEVLVQPAVVPRRPVVRPIPPAEIQRTRRRVTEAIVKYLTEQSAAETWAVEFDLTDEQARALADPALGINVAGGNAPWTGSQRFDLSTGGKTHARTTIEAKIRTIPPVVVALRPLARGAVIHEGDVELQHLAAAEKIAGALHSLEEAIGHELVRPVATGSPVAVENLRAPLAVHRGEVVTVFAQCGEVRIRTNARAHDEGSVGDLVAVESLLNHGTYYARVSGMREVEVYARPPRVDGQADETAAAATTFNR